MPYTEPITHPATEHAPSLDGWWIACSADLGGVRLPREALPGLAMVLSKGTLFLGSDIATIDVDQRVAPHTIDVLIVRGPNRSRFIPGIFRQSRSALRICLDLSGERRPSAFHAPFGSRNLVVEYRRAPVGDVESVLSKAPPKV